MADRAAVVSRLPWSDQVAKANRMIFVRGALLGFIAGIAAALLWGKL